MVKEYLERTKQEFVEQKLMIQKDIVGCQNRMKENTKFIEILEDSNDPNYDAFTPRETNSFNRKKIAELQENQKIEFDHLSSLQDELQIVENKIDEITNVMKDFSNDSSRQNMIDYRLNQLRFQDRKMHRLSQNLVHKESGSLEQINQHMDLCLKMISVDPERAKMELSEIHNLYDEHYKWMINCAYELYPSFDDGISFDQKMQQLISQLHTEYNIMIDYHTSGEVYRLDNVVHTTILFSIYELCKNASMHSGVHKVMIGLTFEQNGILLNVSDNGHGFDYDTFVMSTEYGTTKLGLYDIQQRVDLLAGKIVIESELQKGCSIQIYIPKYS